MTILVTGGAGYIGSHMTYALTDRGERVVVLDNLSAGVRALVNPRALFIEGDAGHQELVRQIIVDNHVESIIHFAGSVVVPESVADPLSYYANNTSVSRSLIEACVKENVRNFIFSSSAAVYGPSQTASVTEDSPTTPITPYGRSKLMTEWMLEDTSVAFEEFRFAVLRCFNVAGADLQGRTGQSTPKATHLIKRACQVAMGRLSHLQIFGTDFPTPDGTGIRDYIHVVDLVDAHTLALDAIRNGARSQTYNCGYGQGYSVREVVSAVEKITGRRLPVVISERQPGDPASLIADPARIKRSLNWLPKHNNLETIIRSALDWERHASNLTN
ncbi:MAG: UDP-glucose 4-epimerase GalE [Rhizomicrobium sp.]